ncbi:DoxX family protein [Nonomuraea longispora]|uniref:DoxX family protein n=1 Tax=Nonomuraea longispora TaxID=1848320 RepID=UPI003CCC83AB
MTTAESFVGGLWDLLWIDYVRGVLELHLHYPPHVVVVLGLWKIPGAVVQVLPRLPRLKEWPHAGAFFDPGVGSEWYHVRLHLPVHPLHARLLRAVSRQPGPGQPVSAPGNAINEWRRSGVEPAAGRSGRGPAMTRSRTIG